MKFSQDPQDITHKSNVKLFAVLFFCFVAYWVYNRLVRNKADDVLSRSDEGMVVNGYFKQLGGTRSSAVYYFYHEGEAHEFPLGYSLPCVRQYSNEEARNRLMTFTFPVVVDPLDISINHAVISEADYKIYASPPSSEARNIFENYVDCEYQFFVPTCW